MALPENVPVVTIALDRPRRMALTFGAMRRIKEQTGLSITALHEMPEDERMDHFHQFIWALLVNEDREGLTPDDLEEMLHPGNMGTVADGFLEVLYGPATKGAEGNGVPAPPRVKAGKKMPR